MDARSAVGATAPAEPRITLREVHFAHAWLVRGDPGRGALLDEAHRCLGLRLPVQANTSVRERARCGLCMGPRSWLWIADAASGDFEDVRRALNAAGGALFDVSSGHVAWAVGGGRVAQVLNRLCPLDLHPTAFPTGACAQTLLGHVSGCLFRLSLDTMLVLVPRSFAKDAREHLWLSATSEGPALLDPMRLGEALAGRAGR